MKYTKENGRFYKVIESGKPIMFGELRFDTDELNTIHEVTFLTKEQYTEATGIEVVEAPETKLPDYFGATPENQPEEIEE
ncbi:hypothetical protein [Elizabethkingia anophelis]|uniref:hypothetical protein n=1 Tax=Elizabethkingia anophelis TaxID=1117645 RepID=UPI00320A1890